MQDLRVRNSNLDGSYSLRGQYQLTASTGAVTTIAAATTTAGFLFSWQWTSATNKAWLRYVGAKFICTTAYSTAQETAADLIVARAYTVACTGGTAIDTGLTITGSGKSQTSQLASLVADCRIATSAALTAGTHTLDANALAVVSGYTSAVGITVPPAPTPGQEVLFDARDSSQRTPLEFSASEGFIIRNKTLMGSAGVGRWDFTVIWEEGVPNRT